MSEFVLVRSVDAPGEFLAPKSLVDDNPERYVAVGPAVPEGDAE